MPLAVIALVLFAGLMAMAFHSDNLEEKIDCVEKASYTVEMSPRSYFERVDYCLR